MSHFAQLQSALRDHSTELTNDIKKLNAEVLSLSKLKKEQADENRLINTLEYELKRFKEVVDTPEIIFATTGTTSSGKSTLVNLLCGAFIMPEAVGEMSAGVVEIKHGDEVKVEVLPTKGSSWFIGTRTGLSDEDLQALLSEVMHAYNDRREESVVPDCPRIKVTYPTHLGNNLKCFGFPQKIKFSLTILDLPGLKSVSDTQNASVINEYCARAMSFVTYNAAETDAHKQESLLKQVVAQVKAIGGSPARMLFVLNKFDVYEADSDPEASKERAFQYTQKKIREVLARELPEHAEVAQQITPQRLATKPALLLQTGAFKEIERHFGYLVDEDVLEELPRKVERWDDDDKAAFAQSVLKGCYVDEFEETLKKHIQQNLPEILFPPRLRRLQAQGFYPPLQEAAQHIEATLMRLNRSYDEAVRRVEDTERKVEAVYEDFKGRYKRLAKSGIAGIQTTYRSEFLNMDNDKDQTASIGISVISNTPSVIKAAFDSFMKELYGMVVDQLDPSDHFNESLQENHRRKLSQAIEELAKASYYGRFAELGAKSYTVAGGSLHHLNLALTSTSKVISEVLPFYISHAIYLESKRLSQAISSINQKIAELLFEKIKEVNEIDIPLNQPDWDSFSYELLHRDESSFESMKASLKTSERNVKEVERYKEVRKKKKFLVFFTKEIVEQVPVYKTVKYTTANIPSFDQVIDIFTVQAEDTIKSYEKAILEQVHDALFTSYQLIVEGQKKSFKEFEELLLASYEDIESTHQERAHPWEELKERHKALHERVEAFTLEACRVTNSTSADTAKR